MKSCVYWVNFLEGRGEERGRWMAISNGRDSFEEVKRRAEGENMLEPLIVKTSTVGNTH